MRKKRYQNLQKLAEQRRAALANSNNSGPDGETSTVAKSHVQYLVMKPKPYSLPFLKRPEKDTFNFITLIDDIHFRYERETCGFITQYCVLHELSGTNVLIG